jgi:hypothetical protein
LEGVVNVTDLERAEAWLARHGLAGASATPALATRLAARHRARRTARVLLAGLVAGALGVLAANRSGAPGRWPLVALAVLVAALVLAQARLDGWVRRIDRQAAATLPRRATHQVPLGWRAVLGRPHAVLSATLFASATVLAASALTVPDATLRCGAAMLLIGLGGVAAATAVALRDVLTRPVVAEDADSLTVDLVMRVEDARERSAPVAAWGLPAMLLFGDTVGWWNAATVVLALGAGAALCLIQARSASPLAMARQALGLR